MSCEYVFRCLNKDKCYRCFDIALLKLPEDKKQKKNLKSKSTNNFTEDESWKDLEQQVAEKLNNVPTIKEARRSRASGALWFEKGDIVDSIVHPECKERKGRELKSGEKSISIQKLWLEKAKDEANHDGKVMILPFRYTGDDNIYVALDFKDLVELITITKSYMQDNMSKEKELQVLRETIKNR